MANAPELFTSKQNYNTITSAVSRVFDIKLSKVRHLISVDAGFKNENTHKSKLPNEPTVVPSKTKPEFRPESLGLETLYRPTSLFHVMYDEFLNQNKVYYVESCPQIIALMLNGFTVEDPSWLKVPLAINKDNIKEIHITLNSEYGDTSPPSAHGATIASLQQELNSEWIIADLELLAFDLGNGVSFAEHLLENGNVSQYNYLCSQPDLIKKLGLEKKLGSKYIRVLESHCFCEMNDDRYTSSTFFHDSSEERSMGLFKTLNVPFIDSLDVDMEDVYIPDFLLGEIYGLKWYKFSDTPLSNACSSLSKSLIDNRDYDLTDLETNLQKHVTFAINFVASVMFTDDCYDEVSESSDAFFDWLRMICVHGGLWQSSSYSDKTILQTKSSRYLHHKQVLGHNDETVANAVVRMIYEAVFYDVPEPKKEMEVALLTNVYLVALQNLFKVWGTNILNMEALGTDSDVMNRLKKLQDAEVKNLIEGGKESIVDKYKKENPNTLTIGDFIKITIKQIKNASPA